MKYLILPCLLILIAVGCKKKDSFKAIGYPDTDTMLAQVDGKDFEVFTTSSRILEFRDSNVFVIAVGGRNYNADNNIFLQYWLPEFKTGSYPIVFEQNNSLNNITNGKNIAAYETSDDSMYYSVNSTITIDSYQDSILKGAFEFVTTNNKLIRGTFSTKPDYQVE